MCCIMLTCPCNVYPITPHFYIVKLGFTGVYIIFLLSKNMNIVKKIQPKIVIFTAVNNLCILHEHVFVMLLYDIETGHDIF